MISQLIVEYIGTARSIWYIFSAFVILGLMIWRLRVRKEEDFEKREN